MRYIQMTCLLSEIRESFACCLTPDSQAIVTNTQWPSGQQILRTHDTMPKIRRAFDAFYGELGRAADVARAGRTHFSAIPKDCADIIYAHFASTKVSSSGWGGISSIWFTSTYMGQLHSFDDNASKYYLSEYEIVHAYWHKYGNICRARGPHLAYIESESNMIVFKYNYCPPYPELEPYMEECAGSYAAVYHYHKMQKIAALPKIIRTILLATEMQVLLYESKRCGSDVTGWRGEFL